MSKARPRRTRSLPISGQRQPMKPSDFIAQHPVFRFDEFLAAHGAGGRSHGTTSALLSYHVGTGRIRNLRRGLYAAGSGPIDPWVLGSRLAPDAVIAYDGALSFHGLTGLGYGMSFLTDERVSRFVYNEVAYLPVVPPKGGHWAGIIDVERSGQALKVTTRERALVDVLDRLDLGPGPVAAWRCFRTAGPVDRDFMVEYARRLGNRLGAARLGVFLQNLPGTTSRQLDLLERLRPRSPGYFDRRMRAKGDRYLGRWNLVVPHRLLTALDRGVAS